MSEIEDIIRVMKEMSDRLKAENQMAGFFLSDLEQGSWLVDLGGNRWQVKSMDKFAEAFMSFMEKNPYPKYEMSKAEVGSMEIIFIAGITSEGERVHAGHYFKPFAMWYSPWPKRPSSPPPTVPYFGVYGAIPLYP